MSQCLKCGKERAYPPLFPCTCGTWGMGEPVMMQASELSWEEEAGGELRTMTWEERQAERADVARLSLEVWLERMDFVQPDLVCQAGAPVVERETEHRDDPSRGQGP